MHAASREPTARAVSPAPRRVLPPRLPGAGSPVLRRKAACACGGSCPRCTGAQTGLDVSEPGDPLEQEADRVAEIVMGMPAAGGNAAGTDAALPVNRGVHRKIAAGGGKAGMLRHGADASPAAAAPSGILPRGSGAPLSASERKFFEPRFGADFSNVRVHSDTQAHASADALNARAYTSGQHIVFAAGEYAPAGSTGRRLLAHELAHVAQDGRSATLWRDRREEEERASGCTPASPSPGVCGPNVDSELGGVWTRIRGDFSGSFNDAQRRDACLMLIEPIVVPARTAAGAETYGHSTAGLGLLDLARAAYEGLSALHRILTTVMVPAPPSAADLAALDAAAADASAAAARIGTDVALRVDNLLQLSRSIAQVARDAPHVVPPLERVVDTVLRGGTPGAADIARLLAAAGTLAGSVSDLVTRFVDGARVVRVALGQVLSGGGPVVAADTVLQSLGIKLNRDAFDVWGLFQPTMYYTRDPAYGYFPACATPGSPNPAAGVFDPIHECRHRCSNTVQVGGTCWLSGTPNYGTYGIMMRLCFDWTAPGGRAPADMQRMNFAFSRTSTEAFARGYKALDADSPTAPGDWAMATFDAGGAGPSARISGGNRPNCLPTCPVAYGRPGRFNYAWEPVRPHSTTDFS